MGNKNSGRHKITDHVKQIDIYIKQSVIDANGGKQKAKEKAKQYLIDESWKAKRNESKEQSGI